MKTPEIYCLIVSKSKIKVSEWLYSLSRFLVEKNPFVDSSIFCWLLTVLDLWPHLCNICIHGFVGSSLFLHLFFPCVSSSFCLWFIRTLAIGFICHPIIQISLFISGLLITLGILFFQINLQALWSDHDGQSKSEFLCWMDHGKVLENARGGA